MRYGSHQLKIYRKRSHLVITFFVILLPLVFIAVFSRVAGVSTNEVYLDLAASFFRIVVAYVFASILAVLFGIFLGQGKVGGFFLPLFDVLQSFPSFALLPLFTLWFGLGNIAAILFLIITIIWPILFSVVSSIHLVRKDLSEAAYIFGARGAKKFFSFTLPLTFPGFITGSIVGLGEGWDAIVGAEILGISPGIGNFLNTAAQHNNIPILAFGITALLLAVFSINKILLLPLLKKSHEYFHE